MRVVVAPVDVAADRATLFLVGGVVCAVEREVAQASELRFDPVQPAGVERHVDQFDVVGGGVVTDAGVGLGREVRAEVVQDDRQPLVLGVQRADVAQEGEDSPRRLRGLMCP